MSNSLVLLWEMYMKYPNGRNLRSVAVPHYTTRCQLEAGNTYTYIALRFVSRLQDANASPSD